MNSHLVERVIAAAHEIGRALRNGENERAREACWSLRREVLRDDIDEDDVRVLEVALAFSGAFTIDFDDEAYPDEPLAFRAWRAVESSKGQLACPHCGGFGFRANRMDAPGGPRCACGEPSATESGSCARGHGPVLCGCQLVKTVATGANALVLDP